MQFEWDSEKDRANRKKHGVSFDLARRVFEDPNHLSTQDRHEDGEERWQTLGLIGPVAIFLVAHTIEDGMAKKLSASSRRGRLIRRSGGGTMSARERKELAAL